MNGHDELPGAPADPVRAATDAGAAASGDDPIPMLTEVVVPSRRPDPPPGRLGDEYWNRVAIDVQRRVLEGLLHRTDSLLDALLREEIGALVDRAAERLVAEVRDTLRSKVQDAVARAIAEELTRIHRSADQTRGDGPRADPQT